MAPAGDAFRVEASIIVAKAVDALQLPVSALFRHNGQWSAFVVVGGRAMLRSVTVGRKNDREAEILAGLNRDDLVMIHPANDVMEGIRVVERQ